MKYLKFRIGEKKVAIEYKNDYILEATLINKIKNVDDNSIDGLINYKGKEFKVFDISSLINEPKMKRFDGLIFISKKRCSFAIKIEGFYKEEDYLDDSEILFNIEEIFDFNLKT